MNLQLVNSKINYDPAVSHLVFMTVEHLSFINVMLLLSFTLSY